MEWKYSISASGVISAEADADRATLLALFPGRWSWLLRFRTGTTAVPASN